jgi:hypothetical protein
MYAPGRRVHASEHLRSERTPPARLPAYLAHSPWLCSMMFAHNPVQFYKPRRPAIAQGDAKMPARIPAGTANMTIWLSAPVYRSLSAAFPSSYLSADGKGLRSKLPATEPEPCLRGDPPTRPFTPHACIHIVGWMGYAQSTTELITPTTGRIRHLPSIYTYSMQCRVSCCRLADEDRGTNESSSTAAARRAGLRGS